MAAVQVRYIVNDVDAAIAFYTKLLGFKLDMHPAPPFAMLSRGELRLVLSAPNPIGGGGQSMPDGTKPEPGGWNRFSIEVSDLAAMVEKLSKAGVHFRNNIVTGVGGKQIILDDPSGNPIELFEPILAEARLGHTKNSSQIEKLYEALLSAWNKQDAKGYASLFAENASAVGFDGSQMNGAAEVESELSQIFAHHKTAEYISIVREVRFLSSDIALLRAVVGMVSPGHNDINPAVNAIQSLVAVKDNGIWRIALFQNTPAQFHGRPELAEELTEELRQKLKK